MMSIVAPRPGRLGASSSDARTAALLGLATLLGPVGGFAANIVYARTLGAAGRGDLAVVIAALAVCEGALVFGFTDVITRHVATRQVPRDALKRIVAIGLAGSVLAGLLVGATAWTHDFGVIATLSAATVVPIATLAALGRGVLAGRRSFGRIGVSLLLGGFARVLAPVVLVIANHDEPSLALILVAASTAVAAIPVFAASPFRDPGDDPGFGFRPLLGQALAIWPANMAWTLNSRLDQLVLATLVSPADLGRYAVCVTMAELPVVLASGLRQVVLVRAAEEGGAGRVARLTGLVLAGGAVAGCAALVLGDPAMTFLFGPAFGDTAVMLAALVMASAFIVSSGLMNTCLIATGNGRLTLLSQATGLLVTVALFSVLVPLGGGIVAAALITMCTHACVYVVALQLLRQTPHDLSVEGTHE